MTASRHRRWGPAPLRPRAVLVALAVLTLSCAAPRLASASAAPLRSCTPHHGTIVAVDFAHWGGPIVRGCGVGQRTGYALLHAAGFTTAGDDHDGPAVVCRLGDSAFHDGRQYPTPNQDNCVQTPPTTGYWAYWVAPKGTDHWSYSPLGAMGDIPRPGEVELWIFGATNVAGTHGTAVPGFSPATLRAHPAKPHDITTTTTRTSSSPSTTRTTATTSTSTTAPQTHTTTVTTTKQRRGLTVTHTHTHARTHRAARHHRHHGARVTATVTLSSTKIGGAKVVSARPTSHRVSAGSSTPLIVGVALAVLLCVGAARAIWLRRREE